MTVNYSLVTQVQQNSNDAFGLRCSESVFSKPVMARDVATFIRYYHH